MALLVVALTQLNWGHCSVSYDPSLVSEIFNTQEEEISNELLEEIFGKLFRPFWKRPVMSLPTSHFGNN